MTNEYDALLIIDVQNDFCPGGQLAVPDGDQVVKLINQLSPKFNTVIVTQDWHPTGHASFASTHGAEAFSTTTLHYGEQTLWPDHCVQDTVGAKFADSLLVDRIDHVVHKGTQQMIDSYSGFFDNDHRQATGLHDYLQSVKATELTVVGLATDYCVKFTVLDALKLGYQVRVVIDGCRGVNLSPNDVDTAIAEMQSAGAELS